MPSLEVFSADEETLERWDEWLDGSAMASVFHRLPFLRAIERESRTRLYPLVITDDNGPLALFPIFTRGRPPLRAVFSPPIGCALPELGPVLLRSEGRQSEREAAWFSAVRAVDSFIRHEFRPALVRVGCVWQLQDVRPFIWAGYRAKPQFTYHIPLDEDTDVVFRSFKSQIRTDVRRARKYHELRVVDGDVRHLRMLIEAVRARYREQGRTWPASLRYFEEVFERLAGRLTIRAVVEDDTVVAGLGLLTDGDVVRHWFGGMKPRGDFIGLNELLHWTTIQEFAQRGFRSYELMGANTPSLCRHKARMNPRLVTQFNLEWADLSGRAAGAVAKSRLLGRFVKKVSR